LRVGSTAIRLDGDSSLEVDANSTTTACACACTTAAPASASQSPTCCAASNWPRRRRACAAGAGPLRVDAERVRDTSVVNVFDGVAVVDGGGSRLTVRAGKRAELGHDDMRTDARLRTPSTTGPRATSATKPCARTAT
jgi:hypothetical protein